MSHSIPATFARAQCRCTHRHVYGGSTFTDVCMKAAKRPCYGFAKKAWSLTSSHKPTSVAAYQEDQWDESEETEGDTEEELLGMLTEDDIRLLKEQDHLENEARSGSPTESKHLQDEGPNAVWVDEDDDLFLDEEGAAGEGQEVEIEAMTPEEIAELDREDLGAAASVTSLSMAVAPEGIEAVENDDDSRNFAIGLAKIASDTKATDITVLHVAPLVYWTSYMVLVTIFSRPQLNAILGKVEREAQEQFGRSLEGNRPAGRSQWEVMDYGDVVLHLFTPEQREFYDLETFYGAAAEVPLPFPTEAPAAAPLWARKA
eukprot:jgi/Botrbrau1/10889/Bobra.0025s0065.1